MNEHKDRTKFTDLVLIEADKRGEIDYDKISNATKIVYECINKKSKEKNLNNFEFFALMKALYFKVSQFTYDEFEKEKAKLKRDYT